MTPNLASLLGLSQNQDIYDRLQQALSLGLRRQIFIAVCDDLALRDRMAKDLHETLTQTADSSYPKFVTLRLNLNNPNFLTQIAQWLKNNPPPKTAEIPSFQILGIEHLTRQSPTIQRLFLQRLQAIERYLPQLESNLLIWLPQPWLYNIQHTVPEFWRWHTGIFRFEGEPTPISQINISQPEVSLILYESANSREEDIQKEEEAISTLSSFDSSVKEIEENRKKAETEPKETVNEPSKTLDSFTLILPDQPPQSFQTLAEIEALEEQSYSPEFIARAYLNLAYSYRDRIAAGEVSSENLTLGIQAYEQGLKYLDSTFCPLGDIFNDLANLYWMRSRNAAARSPLLDNPEFRKMDVEKAIETYQLALTKVVIENAPQTYAMIQNNLGAAYSDLARYSDSSHNLEQSIRAYEEALQYRTQDVDPLKYASTQNNLGTAYWHLAQIQSPVTNVKAAIAAYQAALTQYNPQRDTLNWAMLQNNLGTAYWNLAQYEDPKTYLESSISAYQEALKYRTQDISPIACAGTQNNLGTAYWHLADQCLQDSQKRLEALQNAIAAYNTAIQLSHTLSSENAPIQLNFDLLATYNNLGLIHYQLATESKLIVDSSAKSSHLEDALQSHLQALARAIPNSEIYQTTFGYVVKTIRAFYQEFGISGQNLALSQIPGQLLPQILPRL
ncbi:MAG: tetratricopeptide repeat protein [Chroococcales cyanobacterium]